VPGPLDELVLSLTARGMTSGEIVAHLDEVYGMKTSKETISTITDKALDSMADWRARPLDLVYPVVFVDAVHVKIRAGGWRTGRLSAYNRMCTGRYG
jgi:transposase-like protein